MKKLTFRIGGFLGNWVTPWRHSAAADHLFGITAQ